MKNKLLFLIVALNTTSHAHDIFVIESRDNPPSESPEKTAGDGIEKVYTPGRHHYVLRNGQRVSYEPVVSEEELGQCFLTCDLPKFKEIETKLREANLDIFKLRYYGRSILQHAIVMSHDANLCWKSAPTKEISDAFIDYVLSKISAEDLNGYVTTSWCVGIYYGTAIATAAFCSPTCFKKIINHPLFDKTTFVNKGSSIDVHFVDGYRRYTNLTAANCLYMLKDSLERGVWSGGYNSCRSADQTNELIAMLKQTFNL